MAGRPASDRLSLSGRAGTGVAGYRSDFLQVWVVAEGVSEETLALSIAPSEHAVRSVRTPAAQRSAEAPGTPSEIRQFLAGFAFLLERMGSNDAAPSAAAGILLLGGRLWALRAGPAVTLDQLTGAPARVAWHSTDGDATLAWCEIDASEVWRLELAGPEGALAVHHRPALVSVLGATREDAAADSSTPTPSRRPLATVRPMPRPQRPAVPRARPWLVAAAGLVVLAGLVFWGRAPVSRALVGTYHLALVTQPAGATVRVDGRLIPGRTPLEVPLAPGEHRVELTYGEFASAVFTVEGGRGERPRRDVAWTGSLGLASADTSARLRVSFDGKAWGALPLWKDDVPVGRHRLSFQGDGIRPWEEEVKIKAGQSTRVRAEPVRVQAFGLVTARAERVSHEGMEDVEGASVFVDGKPAGATPLDLRLPPGPHSVRIAAGAELGPVHLIEVQPGGRFYANTTFGRPADPAVGFDPPSSISRSAPPTLSVDLVADVPLPVRRMRLFMQKAGATHWQAVDLTLARDQGRPRGWLVFPVADLATSPTVRYYVEVETREGEEFFSEVRTVAVTS